MERGVEGRLGSGVRRGGEEDSTGMEGYWKVVNERDCGGTGEREENLMSPSCSSGEGRLTGSIIQSWSRLLPTAERERERERERAINTTS